MSAAPRDPRALGPETVAGFCRNVLERGALGAKLAPPRAPGGGRLADPPAAALRIERPAREGAIALGGRAGKLPRPGALADANARARCLARFAHHELMAVELFAWALLRFPEAPRGLRAAWLRILADEQTHCRLYLERLRAHGYALGEPEPLSDYFWRHEPALDASAHGPRAFLCAMGLTLEQANLDFAPLYRDGFRAAGDEASARATERVHADEVRHVRLAAVWLRRLAPEAPGDAERYEAAVPFPLEAARAKGRRFDAEARRRAGLGEDLIARVRSARSSVELKRRRSSSG